jgi:hypothetical protein
MVVEELNKAAFELNHSGIRLLYQILVNTLLKNVLRDLNPDQSLQDVNNDDLKLTRNDIQKLQQG